MGNIQNGRLNWASLVYTDDEGEIARYLLKHNDVLFNRTNSPVLVGKTAIYKSEMAGLTQVMLLTKLTGMTIGTTESVMSKHDGTVMPELFDKHGGFRRLHSFTLATIIQIETLRFCRRFLTYNVHEADSKLVGPLVGSQGRERHLHRSGAVHR